MTKKIYPFIVILGLFVTKPVASSAQTASVKLATAKAANEEMTFYVNRVINGINVDWGDGNIVTYNANGNADIEVNGTVKGDTITVSGDESLWDTLICPDCELTSIDLSGAKKLRSLYCHKNSLTEIDLRGMTELVDLNCSDNSISNIVYTSRIYPERDLVSIENIDLSNNMLSGSFVIRTNTLRSLDVCGNQITSVSTSANKNLDLLQCGANKLSSISVASCDSITAILCHDNNVSKLALPENSTKLQQIVCDNNIIKSGFQLGSCAQLKDFSCANNQISELRLPLGTKCSSLNLAGNKLTLAVLPKPIQKPDYIIFVPQEPIDISSLPNVKNNDGGPYVDAVTWSERKNNMLDLNDYTYIAATDESKGTKAGTIKWFYRDENGGENEMAAGTSSIKSNDYFNNSDKFTFFTKHPAAFARISLTSGSYSGENIYIETSEIAIGEDAKVGITAATDDASGINIVAGKRSVYITSIKNTPVRIYTSDGILIWSGTAGSNTKKIPLAAGIYIIGGKKYSIQ